eukprot:m.11883 g.11883  ORF g.11883 m.11883 type:complete len:934 (-) comp4550_c0_seq1:83-2884(-)
MMKLFLIVLCVASSSASRLGDDWHTQMNYETIDSCVSCPKCNSTQNGVFYLGTVPKWQDCLYLCGNSSTCISFDYHMSDGPWTGMCYSRTTDNYQPQKRATRVVGIKPGHSPGTAPSCVIPGPPPPPPSKPNEIDCAFRKLGMQVAARNLLNDESRLAYVAKGLSLTECNSSVKEFISENTKHHRDTALSSESSIHLHVSPIGSDANDGVLRETPLKTLNAAKQMVRRLRGDKEISATVHLAPGTYYETLLLGPQDSGTPTSPNSWIADDPTKSTVISGGFPISCKWESVSINGITAKTCDLSGNANVTNSQLGHVSSLFVNGQRWKRARYPNGDPMVPRDGYASAGQGTCPGKANPTFSTPPNVNVTNGGVLLSQGWVKPISDTFNIKVTDTNVAKDAGAFQNFRAFTGGSNSCYNTSVNLPYWDSCTCTCNQMTSGALGSRPASYKNVSTGIIHMFHSDGWGNWMFQVDSFANSSFFMRGGQQTGQSGSCAIHSNDMFIENILEELDGDTEYYYDENTATLYVVPPEGVDMNNADVVVSGHSRVVQLRGSDDNTFAKHISFQGITFAHSDPTFLSDYEMPSGGDWTIHRGGAVFLDGTENITITNCTFDKTGGNSLFLSQHAWYTKIHANNFLFAGDSAIALVGSTDLMNGTRPTYVAHTEISNNLFYEVGYYGKQTSAIFKSICYKVTIVNNVGLGGPRAGINFNDAFMGGDILEGNLLAGYVRETADHASFNSWDRQAWFFKINNEYKFQPEVLQITRNLILNKDYNYGTANSDWTIDHDDSSSYYYDSYNVNIYGSHKWRDGVNKSYVSNLYVTPPDAVGSQQWGVGWYTPNTARSTFLGNTMVNWGDRTQFGYSWSVPTPTADFQVDNNRYFTPNQTSLPFNVGGGHGCHSFAAWQAMCKCDEHSTISADMTLSQTLTIAKQYLQMQ